MCVGDNGGEAAGAPGTPTAGRRWLKSSALFRFAAGSRRRLAPWLAGCASTARKGVDEEAPEGEVERRHASSAGVRLKAPRPVIAGGGGGGHDVEREGRDAAESDAGDHGQDDVALDVVEGQ